MDCKKYDEVINRLRSLELDEIVISQGEIYEDYVLKSCTRHNVHSISKFVTALCVGIAIEEGYFKDGLDELILNYFEDIQIDNSFNMKVLKKAQLRHLLTLTLGHDQRLLDSEEIRNLGSQNLAEYVLNYPMKHDAGSYFIYTSAPFYLLSVMMSKATGQSLLEFARKYLFSKLEITDVDWKTSENGYNLGCTGLEISGKDLHKLGKLMLGDGKYHGNEVVSKKWIKEMSRVQVMSPTYYDEKRVLPKYGYGYGLWICKNGIYFCDGTDGQYIIVVPKKEMIVATVGKQKDMVPITEGIRSILLD